MLHRAQIIVALAAFAIVALFSPMGTGAELRHEDTVRLELDGAWEVRSDNAVHVGSSAVAALSSDDGTRALVALHVIPWERAADVVSSRDRAGLEHWLDASVSALGGEPGVTVSSHGLLVPAEDHHYGLDVGRIEVIRSAGLATTLGLAGEGAVRQDSVVAFAAEGLIQVFVYTREGDGELAVDLIAQSANELNAKPFVALTVERASRNPTSVIVIVLVIAVGLILTLRIYQMVRRRRLREAVIGRKTTAPVVMTEDGSTPLAPWEADLGEPTADESDKSP